MARGETATSTSASTRTQLSEPNESQGEDRRLTVLSPPPPPDCYVPNCTTKLTIDPNDLARELDETNNSDQRTDTP